MALTRLGPNNSANISGINLTSQVTGTLPAANGGTGSTTFSPGKVLQVVEGTAISNTRDTTTTSSSFVSTNATVSITPSSTSSKILIVSTLNAYNDNSNAYTSGIFTIERSIGGGAYSDIFQSTSTDGGGNVFGGAELMNFGGATELKASLDMNMVDSPSTTSSCTYRISMRALGGYGTTGINKGSKLIAMEIEA